MNVTNCEISGLIEFLVRARAAPVNPSHFKGLIGKGYGLEYLADIVRNALFVSKGHRENVAVSLVLERSKDFSRVIRFSGASLGSFKDLHETALLNRIFDALCAELCKMIRRRCAKIIVAANIFHGVFYSCVRWGRSWVGI